MKNVQLVCAPPRPDLFECGLIDCCHHIEYVIGENVPQVQTILC